MHGHAGGLLNIHGAAVSLEPLLSVVVMPEEPVALVLRHGRGFQAAPPIIRDIDTVEDKTVGPCRPQPAPKTADPRPANRHAGMPVPTDAVAPVLVRRKPCPPSAPDRPV